ncbi:hypothetical protein [Kosakonia sacchari]|uniref:hypothetical protein n=1 Tax=Kosakonia sacchari TaxID=1158459 RepID=UPI0015853B40|nr:hypothetical protein [Kosakonia sacchari]NUL35044.1 hypothetical protein [Kosakonia sacchari]
MTSLTVNLLTDNGIVQYPDYRPETADITDSGNSKDILFTPYNGQDDAKITGITLDDGSGTLYSVVVAFTLRTGDVVKFPVGTLTTTTAAPVILRGAPYLALVKMRQALIDLVDDNPQYAQQKFPEDGEPFTAIHLISSKRDSNPFALTWDENNLRVYHYNCEAKIVVIRSSEDAQAFLEHFMYRVDSTEGYFWQYNNNCDLYRSDDFENISPLIDNIAYQQMSQVTLSLGFVFQHHEADSWFSAATVNKGQSVTLTSSNGV